MGKHLFKLSTMAAIKMISNASKFMSSFDIWCCQTVNTTSVIETEHCPAEQVEIFTFRGEPPMSGTTASPGIDSHTLHVNEVQTLTASLEKDNESQAEVSTATGDTLANINPFEEECTKR